MPAAVDTCSWLLIFKASEGTVPVLKTHNDEAVSMEADRVYCPKLV